MPGILILAGMGLQIPAGALVISHGEDGDVAAEIKEVRVRLDLWPTWLEIGCRAADEALFASAQLRLDLDDQGKTSLLTAELEGGLAAITAFAFCLDGFYDTVRNELGRHPDEAAWRKNRTARAAQVSETLRRHLKLDPMFSGNLTQFVKQLFDFRSRAVHPSGSWVQPNYRPEIDSGVHPYLITFSGPHAKQCRTLTLELLDSLTSRAAELSSQDADTGWIDRGRSEIKRLTALYPRRAEDEPAAFSEYLATPPIR